MLNETSTEPLALAVLQHLAMEPSMFSNTPEFTGSKTNLVYENILTRGYTTHIPTDYLEIMLAECKNSRGLSSKSIFPTLKR